MVRPPAQRGEGLIRYALDKLGVLEFLNSAFLEGVSRAAFFLMSLLTSGFSFLFPGETEQGVAWALMGMMVSDQFTGMVAAKAQGRDIVSSKMWRLGGKVIAYGAVLYVARVVPETLTMTDGVPSMSVSVIGGWLLLTETVSVLENAEKIRPGIVPVWVLNLLRSKLKDALERRGNNTGRRGVEDGGE